MTKLSYLYLQLNRVEFCLPKLRVCVELAGNEMLVIMREMSMVNGAAVLAVSGSVMTDSAN